MAHIYVASSWRCPTQPGVVQALRDAGHEVYDFRNPPGGATGFAWSEVDPAWLDWSIDTYRNLLDHPRAVEGFGNDLEAMEWADTFVLVLPCGRSAHLELGWAVGQGLRTAILLSQDGFEPELMYRMVDHLAVSTEELVDWLRPPDEATEAPRREPHPTEADLIAALRVVEAVNRRREARELEPHDDLLSPIVTARCFFWGTCKHTVTDRPQAAHDAMEAHYAAAHSCDLDRIVGAKW